MRLSVLGVLGPVVLGVAAPHILSDFKIGAGPETAQVPGNLDGATRG